MRRVWFACACAVVWILGGALTADAQRGPRRSVTLTLLASHPFFFHGAEVVLRADAVGENVLTYLVDGETRLLTLDIAPPPAGEMQRLEVIGTFFDVGRLDPDDLRIQNLPIDRLAASLLGKHWPGAGELPILVASSARPVDAPGEATLRSLALAPQRYDETTVTVTGRFGGRNLHGELPDSPGTSPHDFVLTSANATVWVVGREPKGDGFELDVQARVDTGRWLEVTGSVRVHEGMALIEADTIRLAEPGDREPPARARRIERQQGPPPEVIFTTPLDGDLDIPTDTRIRIQFSRDMKAESFEDRIEIEFPAATAAGTDPLPVEAFAFEYRDHNRALEISFVEPLPPFTTFRIDLQAGIEATDGAELAPWSLSFSTGR